MSVHGPIEESRRYISGAAKPGVYIGRMKLPSLVSTSRAAPKSIITALLLSGMKMLAGLISRGRIFCWGPMGRARRTPADQGGEGYVGVVKDAQAAQHLVEKGADGGLAKHLLRLEVARGDDEVLQGRALQ